MGKGMERKWENLFLGGDENRAGYYLRLGVVDKEKRRFSIFIPKGNLGKKENKQEERAMVKPRMERVVRGNGERVEGGRAGTLAQQQGWIWRDRTVNGEVLGVAGFENMWLKVEGFKDLIHSWWQGIEGRGSASYRLATKMKEIKQKLKEWNREVFRRLEYNKVVALPTSGHWDLVESERRLSEEETTSKKEAKESYAKWASLEETYWRIKINGVWLSEEKEVREGVANAYKYLLIENSDWKADIERLQLEQISQQEAENLEHPFSEDEIHSALMEMNGTKPQDRTDLLWHFGKAAGFC
ncbi:hypothetical protein CK203_071987 [Vitis vinifera]|uniref:Uncharacterized protein n=1 Tax=Vitis vinifera TaxID=29760 RepID=A0A438F446_VITVI|nr:hypothetical protein CK203_071987 [Vitis vinifera]